VRGWLIILICVNGCGGKRKRAAAPVFDAALVDAAVVMVPPPPGPPPVACARVGLTDAALTAALGRAARVLPAAADRRGPPSCDVALTDSELPISVMIDCTVRGGQADKALAALREAADYTELAELGKAALVSPGQVVFVDRDTECLITVTGSAAAPADLLTLARSAEQGVQPATVF